MNTISFRITTNDFSFCGEQQQAVQISIDGVGLIDLARNFEMPFSTQEGHPDIAGEYSWISISQAAIDLKPTSNSSAEKIAVLECSCGSPGCWPLLVEISATETHIIWKEFEQPHRNEDAAAGYWNYEGFGPFIFERSQYEAELKAIA